MTRQRILFIGGTGIISASCVREAIAQGHEVHCLNRGASTLRPLHPDVTLHTADARDQQEVARIVREGEFDSVVQFVGFVPEHVEADVEAMAGHVGQYVFISSASAYQTPVTRLPVTESTPLRNPHWQYSRDKIACEQTLLRAYRDTGFPVTIVRPSHTYDETMLPFDGGWTVVDRMRAGKEVVVPGDGTSLWTITHHSDFARGFVGLLGRVDTVGEAFHITSDQAPTWNEIYEAIAAAAGATPRLVHVPSTYIAAVDAEWGAALLGDKAHSMVFDNAKIRTIVPGFRATVPFRDGARDMIAWHDAHPEHQRIDPRWDGLMDRLADTFRPPAATASQTTPHHEENLT
ncbi:NAD-dependent epimerase/dehydratase family protein [Demequina aestuarii]|uniref:NAD-dependent epimerase/dehydratase family protein n=1 Tax=Demequina aestuarii TaxID=327095 RepID=UPI00078206F8|nr:NAD-dependent epimerase/dehydratase family protein [Demequina aestuarii]